LKYFQTKFLAEADEFLSLLDAKTRKKIFYNIDVAERTNNSTLFKKLQNEIWEFRTLYNGKQIRLLAFWDKNDKYKTLVIATHGFIKKVDRVPINEIHRAMKLRSNYFETKFYL
jgi:hypothetical protein